MISRYPSLLILKKSTLPIRLPHLLVPDQDLIQRVGASSSHVDQPAAAKYIQTMFAKREHMKNHYANRCLSRFARWRVLASNSISTSGSHSSQPNRYGRLVNQPAACSRPVVVRIGGVNADVLYSGKILSGLYQFNLKVPDLPDGDHQVRLYRDGFLTQSFAYITVQQWMVFRDRPPDQHWTQPLAGSADADRDGGAWLRPTLPALPGR